MYDTIIIGSGPAGLTAGLYAGRYRLKCLILEKMAAGGQIVLSQTIENFPGFPGGVITQEFIDRCRQQVEELSVPIEIDEVLQILPEPATPLPFFTLKSRERTYQAKTVIIATGAQPKRLNIEGEERLTGRGVSYCATCDAPFFRDKEVAIVGGGDRAIEEALFLTSYCRRVMVIHRRNALRASKILEEKARANPRVEFILESTVEGIIGRDRVEQLKIKNVATGSENSLRCDGIFIFVGIIPNTGFLTGQLTLDESGFISTQDDMSTSLKGIFAGGDCRKKQLYQVITAAAEGAIAAASVQRYLL